MRRSNTNSALGWVSLTFAIVLGVLSTILIVTGAANGGLWFTVAAMVLLAASSIIQLVNLRRRRQRGD